MLTFELPLFLVAFDPKFDANGLYVFDKNSSCASASRPDGKAMILFTNDDFAEGYAKQLNQTFDIIAFDTPGSVIELLTRGEDLFGCNFVMLCGTSRETTVCAPIDEVIKQMRFAQEAN